MKLEIQRYHVEGIPVLEYAAAGESSHRPLFLQHGIFGSKDRVARLLGPSLVAARRRVLAVDARRHGERSASPFAERDKVHAELELFDVVEDTARDILTIHRACCHEAGGFDVVGVSMGGYIAYRVAMLSREVKLLATLISSPDFKASAFQGLTQETLASHRKAVSRAEARISAINPASYPDALSHTKIFAAVGEHDEIIDPGHTRAFFAANPSLDATVETFASGHQIVPAMQDALVGWLENED